MIKFLVIALAFLSFAWCEEQISLNVPVDKDTSHRFASSKTMVSSEMWQSAYECIDGKTILKNGSQNLPLIRLADMLAMCGSESEERSIPSLVPSVYADYIRTNMNPGISIRCNLDEKVDRSLPMTEFGSEDLLQECLDAYFSGVENVTFHNLPGCGKSAWSVKNVRCLESLCSMGKEVLMFVWVAGDWRNLQSGVIDVQMQRDSVAPAVGAHALVLVGFDRENRHFIFRNCWGRETGHSGYLYLSYDYVRTYACEGYFPEAETVSANEFGIASASLSIRKWDVGGGNFFRPKAKVWGTVNGTEKDVVSIRLIVQYRNGRRVGLEEQSITAGKSFYLSGRYSRSNAINVIVEVLNSSKKVTAFVKYKI